MSSPIAVAGWSIFARELESILQGHGSHLGKLKYELVAGDPLLHPEEVNRLKRSLKTPKHFSIVNSEKLERIMAFYQFDNVERNRIKAAILATSVEMTLMNRISDQTALMAADQVFHLLLDEMDGPLGPMVKVGVLLPVADSPADDPLEAALEIMDQASVLLASAGLARPGTVQGEAAAVAALFQHALAMLNALPAAGRTAEWTYWTAEAQRGFQQAHALSAQGRVD